MKPTALGVVCEIIMGQAPASETYNNEGIGLPLIAGASDFGAKNPSPTRYTTNAAKASKVGDIILCVRATIGDLNWSDRPYCLGRGVAGVRGNPRYISQNFVWWALDHKKKLLNSLGRGATFKQITRSDIEQLQIPVPPLAEQRRIAAILDQADALRRKRRCAIDALKKLGEANFYEPKFGSWL